MGEDTLRVVGEGLLGLGLGLGLELGLGLGLGLGLSPMRRWRRVTPRDARRALQRLLGRCYLVETTWSPEGFGAGAGSRGVRRACRATSRTTSSSSLLSSVQIFSQRSGNTSAGWGSAAQACEQGGCWCHSG